MNLKELDEQIKSAEGEISHYLDRMETVREKFVKATEVHIRGSIEGLIMDAIDAHLDRVREYGQEGRLGDLKAELQGEKDKLPKLIGVHVGADKNWLHRGDIPKYERERQKWTDVIGNKELRAAVHKLYGYIGHVLVKHGFAHIGKDSDWINVSGQEEPQYRAPIRWSSEMAETCKAYASLCEDLFKHLNNIKTLKKQRDKTEIRELWNKA